MYFGVADNGEAVGLKKQIGAETIKKVETRIAEILKPSVVPSIVLEDYDGRKVIHVSARETANRIQVPIITEYVSEVPTIR